MDDTDLTKTQKQPVSVCSGSFTMCQCENHEAPSQVRVASVAGLTAHPACGLHVAICIKPHVAGLALVTVFEATAAALSVQPDRSQFFRYETVRLRCDVSGTSSDWMVKRNTSSGSDLPCHSWGESHGSSCIISEVYKSDTGEYWCESAGGDYSSILSIRVNSKLQ